MTSGPVHFLNLTDEASIELLKEYYTLSGNAAIDEERLSFPLDQLFALVKPNAKPKAQVLVNASVSPDMSRMSSFYKKYSDIVLMDSNPTFVREMQRWKNNENNAFDSSSESKVAPQLLSSIRADGKMEDETRSRVRQILTTDFNNNNNPTHPVVLENVDCVLSTDIINFICLDLKSFSTYVQKTVHILKEGGCLLFFGLLGAKYFTLGDQRYNMLNLDERSLRQTLSDAHLKIQTLKTMQRTTSNDLIDYASMVFVEAIKEN